MRNAFADELTKLGQEDPRVIMLSGDIGNRLFDKFQATSKDRFFNCGVAEQNMMGVATGLAMSGFRPIAYTITPFITTRCLEQIRTDACYHQAPVTIVAVGAGLSYAGLGPTHHSCEDIALLRALPNMTVLCPADAWEVRAALRAAVNNSGPTYIRIGKKGEPEIHRGIVDGFKIGKAIEVKSGNDLVILSTGTMMPEALDAADKLEKSGYSCAIASFHTVKPLDQDYLSAAFNHYKFIVTIEEHSLIGGFGSAVAEWVIDNRAATKKLIRIGTPDAFFKKSGEQEFARHELGLTGHQIAQHIKFEIGQR